MTKITLKEFCAHWVTPKTSRTLASRLAYNAEEFTTKAGVYAAECFRQSFAQGGFYGTGRKWAPCTSKWAKRKKHAHPTLLDTGTLRDSIKGGPRNFVYSTRGKRDFIRRFKYEIGTNEVSTIDTTRRGEPKNVPYYNTYAAFHNSDPRKTDYTVNQHSRRKPEQRQFIGFSDVIEDHIAAEFLPHLFDGFPR